MQWYMQDGMEVTFSEVVGMEELNDGRPRKVKNCKVGYMPCMLAAQPIRLASPIIPQPGAFEHKLYPEL